MEEGNMIAILSLVESGCGPRAAIFKDKAGAMG